MSNNPTHFRVSQKQAALRYRVSQRTLKRWSQDEALQFPRPHKAHGKQNYWDDELRAWDAVNPELAPDPADMEAKL